MGAAPLGRSLAFNAIFFLNFLLWGILLLPLLLARRRDMVAGVKSWARSNVWLLRHVAGLRVEFRGGGRIPPGALLVASKHQSALETFALLLLFDDPCFVLKRELMWLPIFGWCAAKARMIPVDRGARSAALRAMSERARGELMAGRQIIIFPEGTRKAPGEPPAYKFGAAHLYAELGATLTPVALNTGLFWPRRSFLKRPGVAVIEALDPIPPGTARDRVLPLLERRIERATASLIEEGLGMPRATPATQE